MTVATGQTIGNYRILSKIGTGGMGAVYLAEHPLIGKRIALKVIHRELAGNREVVQRFFQEARSVNKIGNEHIVEVHDFGVTPEGDHFFIMEYLEGRTLASVLAREAALDIMRSLHIGAQIATALAAAHTAGIIHRDLKPDNIMLMPRLGDPDFVKVLDFGLAKMFQGGSSAVQTAAGVLLGTPQYMSPEACESKRDLDHRTDIYALGVLLFQMMTGVLPFDGESMGEVLVKQVTALPPAPRGLNPAIPPSVEQILLRCLAKHVDARFPTMLALRDALLDPEAYLRTSPPMAAARSVAPGSSPADTRQIQAAAQARTRMIEAPNPATYQRTMIDGAQLAPDPGQVAPKSKTMAIPGLAQPAEPKMNTMRIATPVGYSSRPPRRVWPIVLVIGLLLGLGGGAFAVAWFGRKDEVITSEPKPAGSSDTGVKEVVANAADTMGNAGSGTKGSAETGTANTGSANAGSAETGTANTGSANAGSAGSATTSAGSATPPVDAGVVATPIDASTKVATTDANVTPIPPDAAAPVPATKLAKLTLESKPSGATVLGPGGTSLGKTPIKIDWPVAAAPVTFVFKLRGYRDKQKKLAITGNTITSVDLDRIPVANTNTNRNNGPGNGSSDGNSLERPE